ncbi:MAG: hypothetical protein PHG41_05380, partial [Actinomycetota bacterium]|nr:hypothetical protein [Actinomycetota bacterium]
MNKIRIKSVISLVIVIVAILILLLTLITVSCRKEAAAKNKIAFAVSTYDGNSDIYIMNVDSSDKTNITNTPDAGESTPCFSPDGTKIAFSMWQHDNIDSDIYIMNVDGSEQVNITNNPAAYDSYPCFSPDGTKIVFESSLESYCQIYIMNEDGSEKIRLTDLDEWNRNPCFSPDGT